MSTQRFRKTMKIKEKQMRLMNRIVKKKPHSRNLHALCRISWASRFGRLVWKLHSRLRHCRSNETLWKIIFWCCLALYQLRLYMFLSANGSEVRWGGGRLSSAPRTNVHRLAPGQVNQALHTFGASESVSDLPRKDRTLSCPSIDHHESLYGPKARSNCLEMYARRIPKK